MDTVSVITSTHERRGHLYENVLRSVWRQDYHGPVEHIIVADGPDPELTTFFLGAAYYCRRLYGSAAGPRTLRYIELGRNWQRFSGGRSWGAVPRAVGAYAAAGNFLAYLDDDNFYRPQHLSKLVTLLRERDVDFAYGQFFDHRKHQVVGREPPAHTHIDTSALVHRADLLLQPDCQWRAAGYASDADVVRRWLAAGARHAFLPEVTFDYGVGVPFAS